MVPSTPFARLFVAVFAMSGTAMLSYCLGIVIAWVRALLQPFTLAQVPATTRR